MKNSLSLFDAMDRTSLDTAHGYLGAFEDAENRILRTIEENIQGLFDETRRLDEKISPLLKNISRETTLNLLKHLVGLAKQALTDPGKIANSTGFGEETPGLGKSKREERFCEEEEMTEPGTKRIKVIHEDLL